MLKMSPSERLRVATSSISVSLSATTFSAHVPLATIIYSDGAPPTWTPAFFNGERAEGVNIFDIGNWSPPFGRDAKAAGFKVWAWTINDPETMRELVRNGIDAFETDVPRIAADVVRKSSAK